MGHGRRARGTTMRQKRVHFRVERAGRSFAACSPQMSLTNLSSIKLHDAPAAVTCDGCRKSAEFRLRLTGTVVSRSVVRRLDAQRADVIDLKTREHIDIKVQGDGGMG